MSFRTKEFKKLHSEWMKKLKEQGFNDIEDLNSPLELLKTWDSTYFNEDPQVFAQTAEYYQCAIELLNSHSFESPLERTVWEFHTEGLSVRAIETKMIETKLYVWELMAQGKNIKNKPKLNKDAINAIIQRLQKFIGRR